MDDNLPNQDNNTPDLGKPVQNYVPQNQGKYKKIKSSRYRQDIDERIARGDSSLSISNWLLKQDPPERISHVMVNNYRKEEFRVELEAAKRFYTETDHEILREAAIRKKVHDLEAMDKIITLAEQVEIDVKDIEKNPEIDALDKEKLKLSIKRIGIQAAKEKHKILQGGDGPKVQVNVNMDEKRERLRRIEEAKKE